MEEARRYLEYLERNLDREHIRTVKDRLRKACSCEMPDRVPVRVSFDGGNFTGFPYSEAFCDMDKMLANELVPICRSTLFKDDTLPSVRANYGVGTLPSLFGAQSRVINDSMPWVEHFTSVDGIRELIGKGMPDLKAGLGSRVLETHQYYKEVMADYPMCKECIPIYHPDLQGPFDAAHLLWGSDIYYAVYDEPQLLHELLELITQTYIRFLTEIRRNIEDCEDGFVYHWNTLYRGSVVLRNDSAVNLSREMYEEFVKPYDEKILRAFGGGGMHYCGRADQWVFSMLDSEGLRSLNFGQPPNLVFGLEFLSLVQAKAVKKGISIVDYFLDSRLFLQLMQTGLWKGVTFNTGAQSLDEAKMLLEAANLHH